MREQSPQTWRPVIGSSQILFLVLSLHKQSPWPFRGVVIYEIRFRHGHEQWWTLETGCCGRNHRRLQVIEEKLNNDAKDAENSDRLQMMIIIPR